MKEKVWIWFSDGIFFSAKILKSITIFHLSRIYYNIREEALRIGSNFLSSETGKKTNTLVFYLFRASRISQLLFN